MIFLKKSLAFFQRQSHVLHYATCIEHIIVISIASELPTPDFTPIFDFLLQRICPAVLSKYSALYINKVTFVHIYARQDAFACGLPVWLWIRVSCYSGVLPYLHGMTARRVRMRYEQNSCISRIVLL